MEDHFTARLAKASLATKGDNDDLVEKTGFDNKLENLDKKVTSNKIKNLEAEKKLNDLTKKFAQIYFLM